MKKPTYSTWEEAKKHSCGRHDEEKTIIIEALFQKFKVWTKGKGSGRQYWTYQVLFDDQTHIPAVYINHEVELDLANFVNQRARIEAQVFYGVLIGDPDDPTSQQLTGYLIKIKTIAVL